MMKHTTRYWKKLKNGEEKVYKIYEYDYGYLNCDASLLDEYYAILKQQGYNKRDRANKIIKDDIMRLKGQGNLVESDIDNYKGFSKEHLNSIRKEMIREGWDVLRISVSDLLKNKRFNELLDEHIKFQNENPMVIETTPEVVKKYKKATKNLKFPPFPDSTFNRSKDC
jgi:hypothetical protein